MIAVIIGLAIALLDLILKQFMPYTLNDGSIYGFEIPNFFILLAHVFLLMVLFLMLLRQKIDFQIKHIVVVMALASISNLADRTIFGGVRDYINLVFSFNLADVAVVLGIIALVIGQIYDPQVRSKTTRAE